MDITLATMSYLDVATVILAGLSTWKLSFHLDIPVQNSAISLDNYVYFPHYSGDFQPDVWKPTLE